MSPYSQEHAVPEERDRAAVPVRWIWGERELGVVCAPHPNPGPGAGRRHSPDNPRFSHDLGR